MSRPWRRCSACGDRCYWHDTAWVCEGCGSEWDGDYDRKYRAPGDSPDKCAAYEPGDRVWWWFDTGAMGARQVVMPVVRVNRLTVTLRNGYGELVRVRPEVIEGVVDWE